MKSIFQAFLLTALISASAPRALALGGITAGGGGTVDVPHASMDEIEASLEYTNQALRLFLYGQEITWRTKRTVEVGYLKLFGGDELPEKTQKRIYRILDVLQIEFRKTRPCFDNVGNEKDGSIYTDSHRKLAICISGMKLAQKLTRDNYEVQTAALVLHEVSHLLGTTEDEAVSIQNAAVNGMHGMNFSTARDVAIQTWSGIRSAQLQVEKLRKALPHYSDLHDADLADRTRTLADEILKGVSYLNGRYDGSLGGPTTLLSPIAIRMVDLIWSTHARLNNIEFATCDPTVWDSTCADLYEHVFNGARFLYARSYYINTAHVGGIHQDVYLQTHGQYYDQTIPHIGSLSDLAVAVNDVAANLEHFLDFANFYPRKFEVIDK